MIISRFGVMFFDDPVRAFANLRRAARDRAALCFIAWRSPAENPFMTTAERAAARLLPDLPARAADAPGQFAFADRRRVETILEASGWTDIAVRPIDAACLLPEKSSGSICSACLHWIMVWWAAGSPIWCAGASVIIPLRPRTRCRVSG
jgi:hypothetical protein